MPIPSLDRRDAVFFNCGIRHRVYSGLALNSSEASKGALLENSGAIAILDKLAASEVYSGKVVCTE